MLLICLKNIYILIGDAFFAHTPTRGLRRETIYDCQVIWRPDFSLIKTSHIGHNGRVFFRLNINRLQRPFFAKSSNLELQLNYSAKLFP